MTSPVAAPPAVELVRQARGSLSDWIPRRPRLRLPRPTLSMLGPLAMIVSVALSWFAFGNAQGEDGSVQFGLFVGAAAIQLMSWSFVLALRPRLLEPAFGGLDRMYRAHRWAGSVAVVAMFLHTRAEPEVEGGFRGASKSLANQAESLAGIGEIMLYILVAISLVRWFPYRWWRWTHKLLGIPFAFACLHFFTAEKPYENFSPRGWWFNGFMLAGLAAYALRVGVRDVALRGRRYRVAAVERHGSTTELRLSPSERPLRHHAGAFAVLKLQARGLSEPHVFTIASGPDESELRFYVRDLGDWTAKVQQRDLVGIEVFVEGPYGRFRPFGDAGSSPPIWVAGGVGITPFLSAAATLTPAPLEERPLLLYCVRDRADATALAELETAEADGRIRLEVIASSEGARFDRERLARMAGHRLRGRHVAACGPKGLVGAVVDAARSLGANHVETEDFDIRGGVGPDLSRDIDDLVTALRS